MTWSESPAVTSHDQIDGDAEATSGSRSQVPVVGVWFLSCAPAE
jgi:hypothetical protein